MRSNKYLRSRNSPMTCANSLRQSTQQAPLLWEEALTRRPNSLEVHSPVLQAWVCAGLRRTTRCAAAPLVSRHAAGGSTVGAGVQGRACGLRLRSPLDNHQQALGLPKCSKLCVCVGVRMCVRKRLYALHPMSSSAARSVAPSVLLAENMTATGTLY